MQFFFTAVAIKIIHNRIEIGFKLTDLNGDLTKEKIAFKQRIYYKIIKVSILVALYIIVKENQTTETSDSDNGLTMMMYSLKSN